MTDATSATVRKRTSARPASASGWLTSSRAARDRRDEWPLPPPDCADVDMTSPNLRHVSVRRLPLRRTTRTCLLERSGTSGADAIAVLSRYPRRWSAAVTAELDPRPGRVRDAVAAAHRDSQRYLKRSIATTRELGEV